MRTLGSAPANQWRVAPDLVDMTRPSLPPRPLSIAAAPQNIVIDLNRTGMIVVDMQNDFCTRGGWLDHIGVDVGPARRPIGPLQSLLPVLRGHGIPIVWLNWGNRPDRLNLALIGPYSDPKPFAKLLESL